jgi:hypothetical protein
MPIQRLVLACIGLHLAAINKNIAQLQKIEKHYGETHRTWVMDRGITEVLIKLGAAKKEAGRAYALIDLHLPAKDQAVTPQTFTFSLNRNNLRTVRRREGSYLLRSNLTRAPPSLLWQYSIRLTEIEQAFKELKSDLSIRPIYHQKDSRIEAHIFVASMAYCLQVTLKHRLRALAPGLTPRAVLEKFAAMQRVDVHLPTTDERYLILLRYAQPDRDRRLLNPPPRLRAGRLT